MLEHVAMYVARLRSGGRKHYNMRSVLRGIFWNVHSVSCMSGAAGDGRVHTYIYIYKQFAHECLVYVGLAQARPNKQFAHECLVYVHVGLAQARPNYTAYVTKLIVT